MSKKKDFAVFHGTLICANAEVADEVSLVLEVSDVTLNIPGKRTQAWRFDKERPLLQFRVAPINHNVTLGGMLRPSSHVTIGVNQGADGYEVTRVEATKATPRSAEAFLADLVRVP